jgi:hypothetical protein
VEDPPRRSACSVSRPLSVDVPQSTLTIAMPASRSRDVEYLTSAQEAAAVSVDPTSLDPPALATPAAG